MVPNCWLALNHDIDKRLYRRSLLFNHICNTTTTGICDGALCRSQTSAFTIMTSLLGKGTAERFARAALKSGWDSAGWWRPKSCSPLLLLQQPRTPCWLTPPVSGQDYNGLAGVKLPWDFPVSVLKEVCRGLAWCFQLQLPAQLASHSMTYLAAMGNYFTVFQCLSPSS